MGLYVGEMSLFFILGTVVGSFANVIIHRWPKEESIVFPRSHCPHCKAFIPFYLNVPILAWVFLKGRAKCCGNKISWRYPFVELLCGLVFAYTFYRFGLSVRTIELCLFFAMALPCVFIDLKHYLLPDILTLPGVVLGVVGALLSPERSPVDALLGAAVGAGSFWFVSWIYKAFRGREGMGLGDVKLIAWIGALGGLSAVPFVIFISSFLGAALGLILIVLGRASKDSALPFGPFLIGAAWVYFYL